MQVMRATGPDVSHHHPLLDINRLLDTGVSFLGMKVSQGASYVDPWFARHLQAARDAGDRLAAVLMYHFAEPAGDAGAQAARFLSLVGTPAPGDVLVLDVEERTAADGSVVAPPSIGWVDEWFAALGPQACRLVAYTSERVWRLMGNPPWTRAREGMVGLWAPRYGAEEPPVPDCWSRWDLWQYSGGDEFPGIDGPTDGNYFRGDADELRAWARPPAPF